MGARTESRKRSSAVDEDDRRSTSLRRILWVISSGLSEVRDDGDISAGVSSSSPRWDAARSAPVKETLKSDSLLALVFIPLVLFASVPEDVARGGEADWVRVEDIDTREEPLERGRRGTPRCSFSFCAGSGIQPLLNGVS